MLAQSSSFAQVLSFVSFGLVVGCGSVVTYNDGPEGGGGEGGGGPVVPPTNPPQCPAASPEAYGDCTFYDGACSYAEQGCVVEYVCAGETGCFDGAGGSGGSYGGCEEEYWYWQPASATCSPEAVACDAAVDGDRCALPGDYCSSGFDCEWEDKYCGEDHVWTVSQYEDECCYDECCYDECCEAWSCPAELPAPGDFCDPCYDASACSYVVELECGVFDIYAGCTYDYVWEIGDLPVCEEPQPG